MKNKASIGASEIATLLGLNPWKTPYDLYREHTGEKPPFAGNAATRRGNRWEFAVGHLFQREVCRQNSWILRPWEDDGWAWEPAMLNAVEKGKRGYFIRHNKYPWLTCTPDFLVYDDKDQIIGILEAKTTNRGAFARDWATVPEYYRPQVIQQGMCLQSHLDYPVRMWIAGLASMDDGFFTHHEVTNDPEMEDRIMNAAGLFCTAVEAKDWAYWTTIHPEAPVTAPEPASGAAATVDDSEAAGLISAALEAAERLDAAKQDYETARRNVESFLTRHGLDSYGPVTWRHDTATDWEAVARKWLDHRTLTELAAKHSETDWKAVVAEAGLDKAKLRAYQSQTGPRKFRIKEPK